MLPAAVLALFGTAALGAAALHPIRVANVPVGILAPGDAAQVLRLIAAADGRVIGTGGWMGAVFAASDDPDFADRLYRAGAVLVFRADRAVGCADLKTIERTS
jgi:hypothetical protein